MVLLDKINNLGKFDFIYLRFFLHAINFKSQLKLFKNIQTIKNKDALLMLEFRTDNIIMNTSKLSVSNKDFLAIKI